jgi:geranylgeranyl diphosphate synthase, type II
MQSFQQLSGQFEAFFSKAHFSATPANLYDAAQYLLAISGKRVRPVACLMGNDLFDDIKNDTYLVATALEIFHNFSLVHDDIMDNAPLRRGMPTVHEKWNTPTAILAGDVMLVKCYEYLNKIDKNLLHNIMLLFNKTATEVCEGQQLDMDFESRNDVSLQEYEHMITLKTSVLLAASLQLGAIMGGASQGNQEHIYEFGKNLGIAFQIQDDYLDAFGDPEKFGKQVGGDILANKKTFLLLHCLEEAKNEDAALLQQLLQSNTDDKVAQMLLLYKKCGIDAWALELKQKYFDIALKHLDDVAVLQKRKAPLVELASFLVQRQY